LFDSTDRRLLRLAGPAFLTLAGEPIYILVDTAIVGHLGTTKLGGLAIAGTVLSTVSWLIGFLATGVTTQVAQRLGAGDERSAREAVSQGLLLAAVLGVLVALFAGFGARTFSRLLGAKGDVLEASVTYLSISALGLPAIALTLLALGWFRGREQLQLPVRVVIGANIANVLMEILFVYVLHLGIAGSAWSTTIVQWLALGVYVANLRGVIRITKPDLSAISGLLRIGGAMVIRTFMMVSTLSAATWFASRSGDVSLAAHQIGVQIYFFFALMVDALAISSQSVFASQMGQRAETTNELWSVAKRLMRLGLIAGVTLAAVLVVAAPLVGRFFSNDKAVLHRSVAVLLWCALLQISGAVVFVLDGVLMGAALFKQLAIGAFAAAITFWVFATFADRGPTVLRGLSGVWLSLNAWMFVRMVTNVKIAQRNLASR
jgi:putative MATE family efflux protein